MKTRSLIALGITVLAAAWLGSAYIPGFEPEATGRGPGEAATGSQAAAIRTTIEDTAAIAVQVRTFTAAEAPRAIVNQGQTQADRRINLMAETSERVAEVMVSRGQRVEAGAVLARLETRERQARLDEARALQAQRDAEVRAARELQSQGFQSSIRLSEAEANLAAANAMVDLNSVELSHTRIVAPVDGFVQQRMIEEGGYIDRGDPAFEIVDLDPIKVVASIPEADVSAVSPGMEASVRIPHYGSFDGVISFVAAVADPVTRTFEVEVKIPNPENLLRDGLTAEVTIPIGGPAVHTVPSSILTLDDAGNTGVKQVMPDNRAVFVPVEIVGDDENGLWIAGLPETVTLITIGQDFVIDGQLVEPVAEEIEEGAVPAARADRSISPA